jgi:hypothetical protein
VVAGGPRVGAGGPPTALAADGALIRSAAPEVNRATRVNRAGTTTRAGIRATPVGILVFVVSVLPLALNVEGQNGHVILIEGAVTRGVPFPRSFGPGFTFALKDLHGPGYGESARDSAAITPREFAFLARPDDVGRAWDDVERVLWPYTHTGVEVQRATDELAHFPTGTVRLDIVDAEFGPCGVGGPPPPDECVSRLRFRVTIEAALDAIDVATLGQLRLREPVDDEEYTAAHCVLHAVEHAQEHLGQAYLTRQLWEALHPES